MVSLSLVICLFALIFAGLYVLYRMNMEDRPHHIGQRRHRREPTPWVRKKEG